METNENSRTTGQSASATGVDSISSVLQFVTQFSANVQLFGLAAMWIKEASQILAEIQLIAIQHEVMLAVLNEKQNTTESKVRANMAAIDALRIRLDGLVNNLERLAKHNELSYYKYRKNDNFFQFWNRLAV